MENIELYIKRIFKLANRNKKLSQHMNEIVGRYNFIQSQNDKYHNLLSSFSFEAGEEGKGRKKIHRFNRASLLYASIEGFGNLSTNTKAMPLMDKLDELQLAMDNISKKYNILKIKTVGDIHIYGAGMLEENRTNPIEVIMAAFEMQQAAITINGGDNNTAFWKLSIGIHTGPVLAEPTGKKRAPYRLAGDAVNFTSRLSKASSTGNINISAMTYELVKEFFVCAPSGRMPVKYKGLMETYYVTGFLPNFEDVENIGQKNKDFDIKFSLIQFLDIQEDVLDMMEKSLPENLFYHNIKHTIDVITGVELIGWAEGLSEQDILTLKLAALFHDSGHMINYEDHEFHGAVIAKKMLDKYSYPNEMVEDVCRLIMATKMPPEPKDLLEKVICDSDLDYLGRTDFIPVSNMLYQELKERGMVDSFSEWNKKQLSFIKKHQYYTDTAQNLREVNKVMQIERLEGLLAVESNVE